jgi:RNA polymerase sigma-70 factor (ECF subfamily)
MPQKAPLEMPETPPSRSVNNETLARQAQEGCAESFDELVARYQVPLVHFLRRRTATVEDAEDLTQETFVRAHAKLNHYRSEWSFGTWLFTLARRISINHQRRRQLTREPMTEPLDSAKEPARAFADQQQAKLLWDRAAAVLTESQWSALWLYYVQDLSIAEVSRVLTCTPGAAKALLHRGRRKLATELAKPQPVSNDPRSPEAWIETLWASCQQLEIEHEE